MDKHDFRIGKFYHVLVDYYGVPEPGLIPFRCIGVDPDDNPVLRDMETKAIPFTLKKDYHLWVEADDLN